MLYEVITGLDPRKIIRSLSLGIEEEPLNAVMSTCDVITCINFGYKIAEGAPQNVCRHPEVVKARNNFV